MASTVVTLLSRKKLAKARAGVAPLPPIKGFVYGDGGVGEDGAVIPPSMEQTALNHEIYRKELDEDTPYTFIDDTHVRYHNSLGIGELEGAEISELGLYDEDGDILCIKNFKKKVKEPDEEMTFDVDIVS